MADDKLPEVEVVYLGIGQSNDGECHMFITPDLLEKATDAVAAMKASSLYDKKVTKRSLVIGSKYRVEAIINEEGRIKTMRFGTMVWSGKSNSPFVADFEARDEARDMANKMKRHESDVRNNTELMAETQALRAHYNKLSWSQQDAFMWAVVRLISRR